MLSSYECSSWLVVARPAEPLVEQQLFAEPQEQLQLFVEPQEQQLFVEQFFVLLIVEQMIVLYEQELSLLVTHHSSLHLLSYCFVYIWLDQ